MPKKDLIQLGITGVLAIVLILVLGNVSKKSQSISLRDSKNALPKAIDLAAVSANSIKPQPESRNLYALLEQQSNSIELRRDPFTAAAIISEKSLHSEISLTGILWDKLKPLAIIDGNVVKKGQRVGNKTIMDIKRDRVILSDGQILSEIRLID
jgi:hypothetical protein